MLKLRKLQEVLPSKNKLETIKATTDTHLNGFDPQLTTHGVDLNPQILFEAAIFVHGLELFDNLICCVSLNARLLFNGKGSLKLSDLLLGKGRMGQTVVDFKVIHPALNNVQSYTNCIAQCIYWGKDNQYYLEQNIQRLCTWINTVSTKHNNMICIGHKEIHVEFIVVADWISLEGIFSGAWCYYCPCTTANYFEELNSDTKQRWKLTDSNSTSNQSLLQIPRKNIFICLFHSSKQIVETLLNQGLQLWTTLPEDTSDKREEKCYRLLEFQS